MTKKPKYSDTTWNVVKEEIRYKLIKIAMERKTIEYKELAEQVETIPLYYRHPKFYDILSKISREESELGHGMLSAVVISEYNNGMPGDRFFKEAIKLNLLSSYRNPVKKETFWYSELIKVQNYWVTHDFDFHVDTLPSESS